MSIMAIFSIYCRFPTNPILWFLFVYHEHDVIGITPFPISMEENVTLSCGAMFRRKTYSSVHRLGQNVVCLQTIHLSGTSKGKIDWKLMGNP